MAEKTQQTIPGATDKPTPRVKKAAAVYTKALYEWMTLKGTVDDARSKLIEKMVEDDVEKFTLDGAYEITLKTDTTTKIACKQLEREPEAE